MKKRDTSLDILRLIAITCVILLHVISFFRMKYFQNNNNHFLLLTFIDTFTRAGVPIFFILTGILNLNKKEEKYLAFIKKKIPKLLISYIVFSFIYILYDVIVFNSSISLKDVVQIITSRLASYHLWYMPVIIMIYFLIPFLKKIVEKLSKKEMNTLIMVLFFLGNITSSISVITGRLGRPLLDCFKLSYLSIYMNYLIIGYYLYKYKPKINRKLIFASIASIIIMPLLTLFISDVEIIDFFLNATSPFVIFPSTLLVLAILNKEYNLSNKQKSFLISVSNSTLYMYLIHVLFINIIHKNLNSTIQSSNLLQDFGLIIVIFIVAWLISYLFAITINKIIDLMKNNKDKTSNILLLIFKIVFMITLIYLIICVIINHYKFTSFNYGLLIISICIIIGIFYLLSKRKFTNKKINIILLILYIMFQIIVIYCYAVRPTWDFGTVYYLARDVASSTVKFTEVYYLYICDNNIPLAAFFAILFKPLFMLKLEKFTGIVSILINMIAIDISLVYLYKTIKWINNKLAIPYMILCLFFSPFILYLPIFYSDTLSLPFMTIGFYYLLQFLFQEKKNKYLVISGLLLGMGSLIKPTIGIVIVSLIIVSILKRIMSAKHLLVLITLFIIPMVMNKTLITLFFSAEEMNRSKKPYTHFIMIGLKENGGFNEEDMQFTTKITTYSEKKKKTIEKIKERLYNYYSRHQLLAFYNRKINFTWADGTFYATKVLASEPYHPKYQKYIQDKDAWIYHNLANAEWLMILILILTGTIFRKYLSKKEQVIQLIINVSIFGLFLFLIIWETRSRYLINFTPLLLISSYYGLNAVMNYMRSKEEGK